MGYLAASAYGRPDPTEARIYVFFMIVSEKGGKIKKVRNERSRSYRYEFMRVGPVGTIAI